MDPRNRADEALERARARGDFVVTPDNATSPMDAESTVRFTWDGAGAYVEPATAPEHPLPRPEQRTMHPEQPNPPYGQGQYPPPAQHSAQAWSAAPGPAWQPEDASGQQPTQPPRRSGTGSPHQPEGQFIDGWSVYAWPPAQQPTWPAEGTGNTQPSPNPYQAQRDPGEFGRFGTQHEWPPQ